MSNLSVNNTENHVGEFVRQVRQRLNWHGLLKCALWATAIGGAVMLCTAVGFVWFGYQVPVLSYGIVAGACAVVSLIAWSLIRVNNDTAAHFADMHFGLKDSVRSCQHFSEAGLQGGFYELQAAQTESHVAKQSCREIRYRPSTKLAVLAALCVLVSVALGFKGPSDSVLDRIARENATMAMTADVNEQLRELIEELDRSIDNEEERKLIDPDKLRQWVNELDETKDHKEALRQYAKLERMINQAADAMQQKREEQLLDAAAEELKKQSETRELGDLLKQKKYDKASEKLGELDPEKNATETDTNKKLSEKRKELAKLKAAANRMADAARRDANNSRQSGNQKQGRDGKDARVQNSKNQRPGDENDQDGNQAQGDQQQDGQEMDGELAEMMEDLEEAVEELDQAFEEAELQEGEDGEDGLEEGLGKVRSELDKLGKKLMKMARQRSAKSKLKQLGAKANGMQAGIAQVQSSAPGGKEPGKGTSDATRKDEDNPEIGGWHSALKGIKGDGPSLTKIESADDGTGVSGRTAQAKQREFQRQFESFVEREDIPEDLKSGVKNYFTQIHESATPPPANEPEK